MVRSFTTLSIASKTLTLLDLCGQRLKSHESIELHIRRHKGNYQCVCPTCGAIFMEQRKLRKHKCGTKRVNHTSLDRGYCRYCTRSFSSAFENRSHVCAYRYPEDPTKVYCRVCKKVISKDSFHCHIRIHDGAHSFTLTCPVCERKLSSERALKGERNPSELYEQSITIQFVVHITTHTGNKPHKCKVCTETFINKRVLDHHMRFHGASTKVFRCEYCFKQLSTERTLKCHIQRLHKTTIQCELCKEEFPTREDLKDHLTEAHEPSVCQVCNKSFALPRYLQMHEKLHYNSLTACIKCPICSKLLGTKNIKSHVFRHHNSQFKAWQEENISL